MNLTKMRSKFRQYASDLANDPSDAEIDEYLNTAYRFDVPKDVGGMLYQQVWTVDCVVGQSIYPYPDALVGPNQESAYIRETLDDQGQPQPYGWYTLRTYTDEATFQWANSDSRQSQAQPLYALFYGRQLEVWPVPDQRYRIRVPMRGGPDALGSEGIADDTYALAVLHHAATDYLNESEDDVGVARHARAYERYKSYLQTQSASVARQRLPNRSF